MRPGMVTRTALNALLRAQFQILMMRLHLVHAAQTPQDRTEPAVLHRFRTYRTMVEREFRRWHKVSEYSSHLGCSSRTLNRATLQVADMSAKSFLVARIVLEAKRLLAPHPAAGLGDRRPARLRRGDQLREVLQAGDGTDPGRFQTGRRGPLGVVRLAASSRRSGLPCHTFLSPNPL